jgi:ethanolamine utilization cobalamin adenosyltransferase
MFLMPSHLVQQAIADSPDPITQLAGARAIAKSLRVSFRAVIEHLCNLTLMTEIERDELLIQLSPDLK